MMVMTITKVVIMETSISGVERSVQTRPDYCRHEFNIKRFLEHCQVKRFINSQ